MGTVSAAPPQERTAEVVVADTLPPGVLAMVGYRGSRVPETIHRGLPSAGLTFILSLDNGVEAAPTLDRLPGARPQPVVLSGLDVSASLVQQRRHQSGVQLKVHPLAARSLFGVTSAELTATDDGTYDGSAVLGGPVVRLQDRLSCTRDWSEVFGLVRDHLNHVARPSGVPPVLVGAWELLSRSHGRLPIAQVAARLGVSERHLSGLFAREVGRSPKVVGRLLRFETVVGLISTAARRGVLDLADVAYRSGYADQSHLTREFGAFAGLSPTAWLAAEFRNVQDDAYAAWSDGGHDRNDRTDPPTLAHPAGA